MDVKLKELECDGCELSELSDSGMKCSIIGEFVHAYNKCKAPSEKLTKIWWQIFQEMGRRFEKTQAGA